MRNLSCLLLVFFTGIILINCGEKKASDPPSFTRADSLTEYYLRLHDSLHHTWNVMINDDNNKLKAMQNLLHELRVSHPEDAERLSSFEDRLDQLQRMRYTQKSMSNSDVVEEYDFASNALVVELIAEAESTKEFSYNTTLQKLVDNILLADQRMMNYRFEYDSIGYVFNTFVEKNRDFLSETDHSLSLEKRPLFQMISSE